MKLMFVRMTIHWRSVQQLAGRIWFDRSSEREWEDNIRIDVREIKWLHLEISGGLLW